MNKVVIHGNVPSKSNCYRIIKIANHGSLAKTPALRKYEESFYMQLPAQYRNKEISSFFELHIDVYYPSMRADLDNSLKVVLDCLQKSKAIKNDNKCSKLIAQRFIDKESPRIEFELIEV